MADDDDDVTIIENFDPKKNKVDDKDSDGEVDKDSDSRDTED